MRFPPDSPVTQYFPSEENAAAVTRPVFNRQILLKLGHWRISVAPSRAKASTARRHPFSDWPRTCHIEYGKKRQSRSDLGFQSLDRRSSNPSFSLDSLITN